MSDSLPDDQLSKELAKELVDMIAEVERDEATEQEKTTAPESGDEE